MSNINNYNLSYLSFLEVVKEFRGFLAGLPKNSLETDIINFTQGVEGSSDYFNQASIESDAALTVLKNEIIPSIFDRTVGGYLSLDIVDLNINLNKRLEYPLGMGEYVHFIGVETSIHGAGLDKKNPFISTIPFIGKGVIATIDNTLKYINGIGFEAGDSETNESSGEVTNSYITGTTSADKVGVVSSDGVNSNTKTSNKYSSPQLNSFVFRSPEISILNKNANHLPVFFNAIPPIELSKCAPYLNLTMLTRKLPGRKDTSYVEMLRYGDNGDSVKYNSYKPAGDTPINVKDTYDFNYMDLFTSPQTLSNADINRAGMTWGDFLNNNDPVLEPIMPLLTLKSATISISGKGYGLMSSKKARLSLTLHDRSRLSEIGPLVAADQIGSTRFIIEYGWNHPQGQFQNNDNSIAKYLNALKDVCLFTVTSSSYSFTKGGSVDISLELHASGYRQTDTVHIGAGPVVPINVFSELIDITAQEIIQKEKKEGLADESFQEVRSKFQSAANDGHSVYSNVSWDDYRKLSAALKDNSTTKSKLKDTIISFLYDNSNTAKNHAVIDTKRRSMQEYAIKKLEYLKSDKFIDPYLASYVTAQYDKEQDAVDESISYNQVYQNYIKKMFDAANIIDEQNINKYGKFVTLGSVIAMFIAYPIASICRADEVQLIFNPLNHQAAGARKYTTANFPVSLEKLEKLIYEKIKKNVGLTTTTFLNALIKDIVEDRASLAYGMTTQYEKLSKIESNRITDPFSVIITILDKIVNSGDLPGFDPGVDINDDQLFQIALALENVVEPLEFVNDNKNKTLNKVLEAIFANSAISDTGSDPDANKTLIGRCSELYNDWYDSQYAEEIKETNGKIEKRPGLIYDKR